MKNTVLKIFLVLVFVTILLCGCRFNSGIAIMKIESSTKTSWEQSHDFFSGTEKRSLSLGKEPKKMEIAVVTEEGRIDITVTEKSGEEIIALEDAKTGAYEFIAEGKIKIKIEAKEHKGGFLIKEKNS